MLNWSVDVTRLKKNSKKYTVWKLIQMINYGLDGERIEKEKLIKNWTEIKDKIDPYKRRVLEYMIWGNLYSLPNNLSFWNVSSKKVQ